MAQTGVVQNHSYLGGKKVITSGTNSTNYADGIIPGASITVYLTNTTTKATIQTVTGGVLANPFFSNAATAVDPGGFVFRAATNVGYDVVASGGGGNPSCTIQPNCYAFPVTLLTGVYASSSLSPVVNPLDIQTNEVGNSSQVLLDFKDTASVKFTNPSGGIESATVPDGSNSAKGVLKCDGTTTDCTGGTIVANPGVSIQTNGTPNTSQTVLNHVDTASVSWANPSGGIEEANVNFSGSLTMQIIPPIAGQYVYVPATSYSITQSDGPVSASNTSATMTLGTGAGFEIDDTVVWSGFALPSYVLPGNVTAIYAVGISNQTNFFLYNGILAGPGEGMTPGFDCTGAVGHLVGSGPLSGGWTGQQVTQGTTLTGATFNTTSCTAHIGANFSGGGNMNVSKIGFLVYYTGTAPPPDNRIIVTLPLTFNPDSNALGINVPNNVATDTGSVNSFAINMPDYQFQVGLTVNMNAANANTSTTPVMSFNGNANRTIVGPTGLALAVNDIITTRPAILTWGGTNWILQNPQVSGGGGATTNALTAAATGGAAPGTTFNGSAAVTLDYHSFGAAPLASPTLTGIPAAPTAVGGTNTTQLATTAFVQAAIAAAGTGAGIVTYSGPAVALTGTQYFPIGGGATSSTTETNVDIDAPAAVTIQNMTVQMSVAPGIGNSIVFTWRKNATNTALTCTISGASATSCSDTTHNFSTAALDLLDISTVTTGTVAGTPTVVMAAQVGVGIRQWSCQPGIGDGLNAITAGTYLQSTCKNTTGSTVTLTGLQCFTDNAGTSTMNAAGNTLGALLTGAVTCSSSFAAGTQSANVALTNGDYIKFTFVADGTSKQSTWIVTGTY